MGARRFGRFAREIGEAVESDRVGVFRRRRVRVVRARGVFYPPAKPLEYDLKTKRLARAEAQDFLLRLLIDGDALSEEEVSIVKWGRNAAYGNIPTRLKGKGKGGHGTYRNASALECLVGYLYVVDRARLQEVMTIVMSETAIEGALALSSK